ncbi:hypothetical protein D9M71_380670 [compost metagenome]
MRLEAFGVGQGIAQHQTAFGVGVEDFHGLPAHGGDDVTWAGGTAAWHVLGAGQQAHQVDRQLQLEHCTQGAEHAGGAAHVVLHFIHAGAWLEADAASVEGNAFTHQHEWFVGLFAALVIEHDQAWRLVAALAHGVERAHAQVLDLFLVQHFNLEGLVRLAQFLGLFGQEAWVAKVGWQVAEVTGEGHAAGDGAGMLDRTLDFGLAGFVGQQGDLFQRTRLGFLAFETVEHIFAVQQGFGQQAVFAVMGVAVAD